MIDAFIDATSHNDETLQYFNNKINEKPNEKIQNAFFFTEKKKTNKNQ